MKQLEERVQRPRDMIIWMFEGKQGVIYMPFWANIDTHTQTISNALKHSRHTEVYVLDTLSCYQNGRFIKSRKTVDAAITSSTHDPLLSLAA